MSIITATEREYLLNSMMSLLDEYDYDYSRSSLELIIDTWATEKETLIEAFKKHPNYLEGQFMIAFDSDYERGINQNASRDFSWWLRSIAMSNRVGKYPTEIQERVAPGEWLPYEIYEFFYYLHSYAERVVSTNTAVHLNRIVPGLNVHVGQKTSRVVNKLCCYLGFDKVDGYNREFAKYADSLSPLVIKRHTVLSINPLDYLTMSFGNSWASCHTIDKENKRDMPNDYSGCYSSGTISYMLDPSSMVLYTVDASYNGNEYWNQPKINRQMFHWGEEKLVQGRLYPQDNDGDDSAYVPYRNIVQQIMSTIFDFPNLWTLKKGTSEASRYINSRGTNYEDYAHYGNCSISRIKESENERSFVVGVRPICIVCGDRHTYAENINCCTGYVCEDCGRHLSEDDVYWVGDYCYCRDCVEYCENCNEYHRSDSTYIEREDRYVCEYCIDNYYRWCDCCDEYVHEDEISYIEHEDRDVCDRCLARHYTRCECCGEYFDNDEITFDGWDNLCEDCHSEKYPDETEEADEEAC